VNSQPLALRFYGDPILRRKGVPVVAFDAGLRERVEAMFECMYREAGIGLAAPQVGLEQRLFVVDVEGDDGARVKRAFVNPVIRERKGAFVAEEGCLSIPGIRADVKRADFVVVDAIDEWGQPFRLETHGLLSRAIQHEMDHLDGILFIDRLSAIHRKLIEGKLRKSRPAGAPAEAHGSTPSL